MKITKLLKKTKYGGFIVMVVIFILLIFEGIGLFQGDPFISDLFTIEDEPEGENLGKSKVIRVVDGDTVVLDINNVEEKVRLIGINTPETVDPRKEVECFGVEASNKAKDTLEETFVEVELDLSQGERDKYGRMLVYIILEDGTNFNMMMIEEGFAYEYTYDKPYKYQEEFKSAEKVAKQERRGLWGDACTN